MMTVIPEEEWRPMTERQTAEAIIEYLLPGFKEPNNENGATGHVVKLLSAYGASEREAALSDLHTCFTKWRQCAACIYYAERGEPSFDCPQCAELNVVAQAERKAGEIAGLEASTKLICSYCFGGHYHKAVQDGDGDWIHTDADRHADPRDYVDCPASPIHNELARRRAEQGERNAKD